MERRWLENMQKYLRVQMCLPFLDGFNRLQLKKFREIEQIGPLRKTLLLDRRTVSTLEYDLIKLISHAC